MWVCPKKCKIKYARTFCHVHEVEIMEYDLEDKELDSGSLIDTEFVETTDIEGPMCSLCGGALVWSDATWGDKDSVDKIEL